MVIKTREWIHEEWIDPALDYICNLEPYDDWNDVTPSWQVYTSLSYWAHRWNLCPLPEPEEEPVIQYRPVVDPIIESEWKHDLLIVAALSSALSVARLLILLVATKVFGGTKKRRCQGDK
jgi:hypothetical protein